MRKILLIRHGHVEGIKPEIDVADGNVCILRLSETHYLHELSTYYLSKAGFSAEPWISKAAQWTISAFPYRMNLLGVSMRYNKDAKYRRY